MPPSPRVIYLDSLLLLSALCFTMDFLLLWATAKVARVHKGAVRLVLGASLGTLYFVVYYLAYEGIIPHYGWLRFSAVIISVSVLMLALAFAPVPLRRLPHLIGYFYFIAVSSGGAGVAAGYALDWGAIGQIMVSIAAILVTAELGWGVVQKSLWQRVYQVKLEVILFGDKVEIQALIDTGNQLRDPLNGSQVVVLEHAALAHLLPDHLRDVMVRMEKGDLTEVSHLLTAENWSARFRVIPFTSLGKKNGLLIGFRPDDIAVKIDGRRMSLTNVVVAVSPDPLDPDGVYQALVHPEILQSAVAVTSTGPKSIPTREGESSHVTPSL